jgi:hypothetical protein
MGMPQPPPWPNIPTAVSATVPTFRFIFPVADRLDSLILVHGSAGAGDNEPGKRKSLAGPGGVFSNESPGPADIHLDQSVDGMLERPGLQGFQHGLLVLWKRDGLVRLFVRSLLVGSLHGDIR